MDELTGNPGMQQPGPPPGMSGEPSLANSGLSVPMLISPQGFKAPTGLDNYTPSQRTLHPRGTTAPIDDMQVSGLGPTEMKALRKALQGRGIIKKKGKAADKPAAEPFNTSA